MTSARLLTAALALAALPPVTASAVEEAPKVLQCAEVGAFVSAWMVAGEPFTRVVVHGSVRALSTAGDVSYTTICGQAAPQVVCVEQSAAGLAIGDAVTLEGVVASADGAELVLDPCGAILLK
jgi:cytidine deaminase